jgi:hypothetical protein
VRGVKSLEIEIATVLRVALAIVGQRAALVPGLERAADICPRCLRRGRRVRRLVDVVAEVQHEVDVLALSQPAIDVEVAGVELGTRDKSESGVVD